MAVVARTSRIARDLLVDVWAPLQNYIDGANRDSDSQEKIYQMALRKGRAVQIDSVDLLVLYSTGT